MAIRERFLAGAAGVPAVSTGTAVVHRAGLLDNEPSIQEVAHSRHK
jgi:hypothetical protein